MRKNDIESVYAFLYKDRTPFARARLFGEGEYASICGSVSFYETPLGVLIRAELCGLSKRAFGKRKSYNFCVRDGEQSVCGCAIMGNKRSWCALMPTAYEKDGCADCVIITRKISPTDIIGKTVAVFERTNGCPKSISDTVARGRIER